MAHTRIHPRFHPHRVCGQASHSDRESVMECGAVRRFGFSNKTARGWLSELTINSRRQLGMAVASRKSPEDGWGQPSLPTLGQVTSPEGATCVSPGRQPRVGRPKRRTSPERATQSKGPKSVEAFNLQHSFKPATRRGIFFMSAARCFPTQKRAGWLT